MTGVRPVRVLVADDQAVVRDGLVLLLSTYDDIAVVGAAVDGRNAVDLATELLPDVLLCDLRMPVLSGAEVTAALTTAAPGVRVLVLTTFADDEAVLPALQAGAAGYLTKDTTGEALLAALLAVADGQTVLDPAVQHRLVELLRKGTPEPPTAVPVMPDVPEGLTRRELDVIALVAQGLTNQQVARSLVLSEATVKTHLNHVLSKLDVDGRAGLVAWAWRHGIAT